MPIDSERIKLTLEITNPSALNFLKQKQTIKAALELGGADFNKLNKLKKEGLKIKTQLQLEGKGYDQLIKWQREGIKIKASIEGLPSLSTGSRSSGGGRTTSSGVPISQKDLNAAQVAEYDRIYAAKDAARDERERRDRFKRLFETYVKAQEQLTKATQDAARAAERMARANERAAEQLIRDLSRTSARGARTTNQFTRGFENSSPLEGPDAGMLSRRDRARIQERQYDAYQENLDRNERIRQSKIRQANIDAAKARTVEEFKLSGVNMKAFSMFKKFQTQEEDRLIRELEAETRRETTRNLADARKSVAFNNRVRRTSINDALGAGRNFRISQSGAPKLFRANTIEDRAITEVLRSPSFFNLDEVIEDVAFRNNTTPSRLTSALTIPRQGQGFGPLNPNRRKFFDPSRVDLKDKQLQKELGFSFLFGGPTALAGSLAGESIAPGGAFLGGAAAQVGVDLATRGFETLIETLRKAAEAGLVFNESILGISATLQATSRVTGPGGQELSFGDQLKFQQGRARDIQVAARSKLLKIGIGGEKEATLVQAIVAGAAQRGIQLTPEEAATLAERIGGAVQAQRPELLGNASQLRRDVEDLLSGLPNRTVLGSLVKGFAPNIGTAASGKDLIQASQGLAQFPAVLAGSRNNPVTALNQLNSAFDNLNTTVGDKLITSLIPAINSLSDALSDSRLAEGLTNFVVGIGTITSALAQLFLPKRGDLSSPKVDENSPLSEKIGSAISRTTLTAINPFAIYGNLFGSIGQGASFLENQVNPKGSSQEVQGKAEIRAGTVLENVLKDIGGGKAIDLGESSSGKDSIGSRLAAINSLPTLIDRVEEESIAQINKDLKDGLNNPNSNVTDLFKSQRERIKAARAISTQNKIGANLLGQSITQEKINEEAGLIDTSSFGGEFRLAQFQAQTDGLRKRQVQDEIKLRKEDIKSKQDLLDSAKKEAQDPNSKVSAESIRRLFKDVKDATAGLEEAENKLIKIRREETSTIDSAANAIQKRLTQEREAFNPSTFAGQRGLLDLENRSIGVERRRIASRRDKLREDLTTASTAGERADILDSLEQLDLDSRIAGNRSEILGQNRVRQSVSEASGKLDFIRLGQNDELARAQFGLNSRSLGLQGQSLDLQSASLKLSFAELADKSKELAGNFNQASRALEDFKKEAGNRSFGRQSQLLSAIDAAREKGVSESTISNLLFGTELSSLSTEGEGREAFERKAAESNLATLAGRFQTSRIKSEEAEEQIRLENAKKAAERAERSLAIQEANLKLDEQRLDIAKQQLIIDQKRLIQGEQDRQFNQLKQLIDLGLQFKGETGTFAETVQAAGADAQSKIEPFIKSIITGKPIPGFDERIKAQYGITPLPSGAVGLPTDAATGSVSIKKTGIPNPNDNLIMDAEGNYFNPEEASRNKSIYPTGRGVPLRESKEQGLYYDILARRQELVPGYDSGNFDAAQLAEANSKLSAEFGEDNFKDFQYFQNLNKGIFGDRKRALAMFEQYNKRKNKFADIRNYEFTDGKTRHLLDGKSYATQFFMDSALDRNDNMPSPVDGFEEFPPAATVAPGTVLPFELLESSVDVRNNALKGDVLRNTKGAIAYKEIAAALSGIRPGSDRKDSNNVFDSDFQTGKEQLAKIKPGFASTAVAQAAGEGHKEMVSKVGSLEQGLKSLVQAAMDAPGKTGAAFQAALQNSFGN